MIKNVFTAVAATLCLSSLATASYADVTVVSQVGVIKPTTQGTIPISRTVTTYFKDGSTRIETNMDKSIILYNDQTKVISVLNPTKKTYYEKPAAQSGDKGKVWKKLSQFVTVTTTGGIQLNSNGRPQTIAGVTTKPYSLLADVNIQSKFQSSAGSTPPSLQVHVEGRFQGAAASSVIPSATADRILLFTQQLMASGWVPDPLLADFMELKVVPMKATLVITPSGLTTSGGGRSGQGPTTVSMEVLSLDEQTPLSNSLFLVPTGYTKVTPPNYGKGGLSGSFGGFPGGIGGR